MRVGSIDFRNGRHRLRIRQPDGKRKTIGYYDTEDEAERMRLAIVQQLAGTAFDPQIRGRTFGAWGVSWLDDRELTHRDAAGDRQRWNAYVAGTPIAAMKIDAIRPRDVQRWVRALASRISDRTGERLDPQTVTNALTTLRAAFRSAIEQELIDENPAAGVVVPRGTIDQDVEDDEPIAFLDVAELERVFRTPITAAARAAITVGIFAGLRPSELARLEWPDVHLRGDRPELLVRRGKNGRAQRVPLLPPAIRALRIWRVVQLRATPRLLRRRDGRVFPSPSGGVHARGYDWGWTDSTRGLPGIRSRAGVRPEVTWYAATRHTCATHLLIGTWAPEWTPRALRLEEVSRWLRHSSTAVTERHYARFTGGGLHDLLAGSRAGSRGSRRDKLLSHLRDLNPGPTVYESGQKVVPLAGLHQPRTRVEMARAVLELAAARDPRALAVAIDLAGAVIEESVHTSARRPAVGNI